MLKKTLIVGGREYYEQHLRVLNIMFPVKMSEKEIELLGCYMSFGYGGMGREMRKRIMGCMRISESGLSNYLGSLRKKGFVRGNGDRFELWDKLRIGKDGMEYMIILERYE